MHDAATKRTDDSKLMTNSEDLRDNAEETQEVDSQADYNEKNKVAKTVKIRTSVTACMTRRSRVGDPHPRRL